MDLSTEVGIYEFCGGISTVCSLCSQTPEPYKVGEAVYVKLARAVDPNPYDIHTLLGNGQYYLSRDGKMDRKVYRQENLQKEP